MRHEDRVHKWIDKQRDGEIENVIGPPGSSMEVRIGQAILNGEFFGDGPLVTCQGGLYYIDENGDGYMCDPESLRKLS